MLRESGGLIDPELYREMYGFYSAPSQLACEDISPDQSTELPTSTTLADLYRPVVETEVDDYEIAYVPLGEVNIVHQMRGDIEEYISTPSFQELRENIGAKGILNEPYFAYCNPETAEKYLATKRKYWPDCTTTLDQLTPDRHGNFWIVDAGHRRTLAKMLNTLEDAPEDYHETPIKVKSLVGKSPLEMLIIQANENIHDRPTAEKFAEIVVPIYRLGRDEDEWGSAAEFARKTGYNTRAVRRALRYDGLPQRIKDLVEDPQSRMSYSRAVLLRRVQLAQEDYYEDNRDKLGLTEEECDQMVEDVVAELGAQIITYPSLSTVSATRAFVQEHVTHIMQQTFNDESGMQMVVEGASVHDLNLQILEKGAVSRMRVVENLLGNIATALDLVGSTTEDALQSLDSSDADRAIRAVDALLAKSRRTDEAAAALTSHFEQWQQILSSVATANQVKLIV